MELKLRKELISEKTILLSEIKDNPKSIEIYGKNENVDDIVKSMELIGYDIDKPIFLDETNTIICGHRRKWASIKFGLKEVPVKIYKYDNDIVKLEDLLLDNVQRIKTNDVIGREWKELKPIYDLHAKEKHNQGSKLGGETNKTINAEQSKDLKAVQVLVQPLVFPTVEKNQKDIKLEPKKERDLTTLQKGAINYKTSYENLRHIETVTQKIDDLKLNGKIEIAEELRKVLNKSAESAYNIIKNKSEDNLINPETKILTNNEKTPGIKIERAARNDNIVIKEFIPLPPEKFNVILADPPWRYDFSSTDSRKIENQYPTMELEDICKLQVPAADNCLLLLWTTVAKLEEAFKVIHSWGFEYKTNMVWTKDKIGMGYWARNRHEHLLICTKGSPEVPLPENRFDSVINAPRTEHSKKPELYEMIEKMCPNSKYLEMFARNNKERKNWIFWGNQS